MFKDPFAVSILGGEIGDTHEDPLSREDDNHPGTRALRFFIAARSAYAETKLAEAVANRGVSQLVVLGAGFDTFALRNPFGSALRVFEVDLPATQAWKRERLAAMCIGLPEWLTFAGVDFERESFVERLVATGFDPAQRSFVFWLGVTMYLTREAVERSLAGRRRDRIRLCRAAKRRHVGRRAGCSRCAGSTGGGDRRTAYRLDGTGRAALAAFEAWLLRGRGSRRV